MAAILNSAIMDSAILHKKNFTHSIWLNLMMAAILNSAILDFRHWAFWIQTPCYLLSDSLKNTLHFILTLTQTNSIWLKLIHSHLTWWWQSSWIWPSWIEPFCAKSWLKLVQSDSNSFILTQLDDISHLEFCHLGFRHCQFGFRHLVIFSQIY